jgi:hypothetical protein
MTSLGSLNVVYNDLDEAEVGFGTLNFVNAGFLAAAIYPDARTFVEKPASRNIFILIFTLI